MKLRTPTSAAGALRERPAWQSYGFAALMLVAALVSRWSVDAFTHDAVPLISMYLGVAFAVWFGGWRPAALLSVVGYFSALWWFLPPRHSFKYWDQFGPLRTIVYFLSCGVVIYLFESVRRAERRRADSEARVVSILENMSEGFCAVDHAWRVIAVNHMAEAGLGHTREKLLARSLWENVPGARGQVAETELQRAMRDRVAVQFETNTFIAGRWHAVRAAPTADGLSIIFQDITVPKAHVDQLERLVDDRTAALQRLVTELESFSYTLVHDMRAPLRSISGFAELLADDHSQQLDAGGKHYLARIRESAIRMDQLIVGILGYSQLSASRPELHPVDLDATLREILRSHPDFRSDHADVAIEGVLPRVRGNSALLTQCFSNLLHNATKFVAPGVKPRVRIAARTGERTTRVEVCDNGIGIAPEATVRIFEPFRRENPDYDGTGIGLAIVRKVADQLDGRVGVESQVGEGSRFWIELKLASAAAPNPDGGATRRADVAT